MALTARQSSTIALLVAGALFMEQLDGTVIATALPQMAETLSEQYVHQLGRTRGGSGQPGAGSVWHALVLPSVVANE
jgi:hypothetical protein